MNKQLIERLRKYVFFNILQKLSRRQYLRYIFNVRQRPPRFSNIIETGAWRDFRCRAEEGAETTACTADSTQSGASQWVHVPWGNCASPSPPSQKALPCL